MRRIPCDVLITSSRSSLGSTNVSPSSLMLDRADAVWNEMSGWPRYERETDNSEVLCPVGMEVITDNIISSCGLLWLLYFCLWVFGSTGISFCGPSLTFFNLLHSCSRTNTMQILRDTLYMFRLKYSRGICSVILFIFQVKRFPHHSSVINACCHAENDFEICKCNEQEFC